MDIQNTAVHEGAMQMRQWIVVLFMVAPLLTSGCATIVANRPIQEVYVTSVPERAVVTVTDQKTGQKVFQAETPAKVPLESSGGYFQGRHYRALVTKEGYPSHEYEIRPTASGWYIGGNLLLGGIVGWLIVDPLSGAMWTLMPRSLNVDLESVTQALTKESPNAH